MSKKPFTASNSQIFAWAVGALATHYLIQTFGQGAGIFTVGLAISPVVIGWAMMLPRFVDAIIDPYLGHLSDETHTPWGRRKPYLVIGAVFGALLLVAMWWVNPHWGETRQLVYLAVIGTLFYLCYGLYTMAWTAMGYELTDDYHERSRVMAYASFALAIVSLSAGWCFKAAQSPIFGHGAVGTLNGMRWISAGVGIVVVVAALVTTLFCKERFTHANREHVPLLPAVKATLGSRPFLVLVLVRLCDTLGGRLGGALMGYLGLYLLCRGDKQLSSEINGWGATIGTLCSFAIVPAIKPLSKKLGKRASLILGSAVGLLSAALAPFILNSGHPYLSLVPTLLLAPMTAIAYAIGGAIVPDICDVDELESGQRREGLFTSVMAFTSKMEISLCTLVSGYLVTMAGVNVKLDQQPLHVIHKLMWMGLIPTIGFAFLSLVLTFRFPMTEAQMIEVRRQLDERHAGHPETAPDNETEVFADSGESNTIQTEAGPLPAAATSPE